MKKIFLKTLYYALGATLIIAYVICWLAALPATRFSKYAFNAEWHIKDLFIGIYGDK